MLFKSVLDIESFDATLTEAEREKIHKYVTTTSYAPGQVIFYEDTMPFGIYMLRKGMVKLYKNGDAGKSQIFQLCTSGDVFGFHAVLQDSPYPDNAETMDNCVIDFIPKQHFIELVRNSNALSFHLLQRLSEEFRDFIIQETMLSQKRARERVAMVILSLYRIYLSEATKGVIPLNRSDMADLCGMAKESLVRVLREFKDEGIIRSENGRDIEVLALPKLTRIAST